MMNVCFEFSPTLSAISATKIIAKVSAMEAQKLRGSSSVSADGSWVAGSLTSWALEICEVSNKTRAVKRRNNFILK